jgi:hypothetical protein
VLSAKERKTKYDNLKSSTPMITARNYKQRQNKKQRTLDESELVRSVKEGILARFEEARHYGGFYHKYNSKALIARYNRLFCRRMDGDTLRSISEVRPETKVFDNIP